MRLPGPTVAAVAIVSLAAGCGGSSAHRVLPAPTTGSSTTTSGGIPPLQPEATAATAGDIPDNQAFLIFRDGTAGYSMKYPEGWAQGGTGLRVVFRDKNNIVRVLVGLGTPLTAAKAQTELASLRGAHAVRPAARITVSGRPALKVVYRTESAANAVTGKRVKLLVDRYYLWNNGRQAVVDLGTPVGVDNVDAYRLMIESFRWR